jgi:hypothetical protein
MSDGEQFQRDVARLLLTFVTVATIDLVVISLVTHRLRFWFPVWLDPAWETRADPWVVYSQSYAGGIFMVPLLWRAIDREWLAEKGGGALRALFWGAGLGVFAFIGWWKGGLMVEHRKELEALGWLALTAIVWTALRVAEELPARLRSLGRRRLLGGLLSGVACFFLGMSLLDPLLQLEVQRVAWSSGLAIEVGFFVPAGALLLWISRRLRKGSEPETP